MPLVISDVPIVSTVADVVGHGLLQTVGNGLIVFTLLVKRGPRNGDSRGTDGRCLQNRCKSKVISGSNRVLERRTPWG